MPLEGIDFHMILHVCHRLSHRFVCHNTKVPHIRKLYTQGMDTELGHLHVIRSVT